MWAVVKKRMPQLGKFCVRLFIALVVFYLISCLAQIVGDAVKSYDPEQVPTKGILGIGILCIGLIFLDSKE